MTNVVDHFCLSLKLKVLLDGKGSCINPAVCNFCIMKLICLYRISSCIFSSVSFLSSSGLTYAQQIGLLLIKMERAFHPSVP